MPELTADVVLRKIKSGEKVERADLRGLAMPKAVLEGVSFRRCDLDGANFEGARLSRALFKNASLREAFLAGADLREANLESADLEILTDLLQQHVDETESPLAQRMLSDPDLMAKFVKVLPRDYAAVLKTRQTAVDEGLDPDGDVVWSRIMEVTGG